MPIQNQDYGREIDGLLSKNHVLRTHGQHEEATALQWRALALADTHLPDRLWPLCSSIAESMLPEGENRYEDALALLDHASVHLKGWQNNAVGQALRQCHIDFIKGKIYTLKKQYSHAEPLLLSSLLPICERSGGHWVLEGQKLLADCYVDSGDLLQAEAYYKKATDPHIHLDWLKTYHSLLERLGKTSTAAEVAQRIRDYAPCMGFGCGHEQIEEVLKWVPTMEVTQEECDRVMKKYTQAPNADACYDEKPNKVPDYRVLLARLLSHLANDCGAEKYFLAHMHLEEQPSGKFLIGTLEQYKDYLKQADRMNEIRQLDSTIDQLKMKFANEVP